MMARFILLTFALLGVVFYQLSGGSDFEPSKARLSDARSNPLKPAAFAQTGSVQSALEENVTRVSLNLTSVDEVLTGGTTQPARIVEPLSEDGSDIAPAQIIKASATPTLLPSLVEGADHNTNAQSASLSSTSRMKPDFRSVSGNRVNVRGGPSTAFQVVNTLLNGDEVEVLEDDGTGWVRMRPLDGGAEGWVADFLLTAS